MPENCQSMSEFVLLIDYVPNENDKDSENGKNFIATLKILYSQHNQIQHYYFSYSIWRATILFCRGIQASGAERDFERTQAAQSWKRSWYVCILTIPIDDIWAEMLKESEPRNTKRVKVDETKEQEVPASTSTVKAAQVWVFRMAWVDCLFINMFIVSYL